MITEAEIRRSLSMLTSNDIFLINKIVCDEKNFGNIIVELTSNDQISIRFINDKGLCSCEIGHAGSWYFIEDIFFLIGIEIKIKNSNFIEFTVKNASLMKEHMSAVFDIFNAENAENTKIKLDSMATKRAMEMFGK